MSGTTENYVKAGVSWNNWQICQSILIALRNISEKMMFLNSCRSTHCIPVKNLVHFIALLTSQLTESLQKTVCLKSSSTPSLRVRCITGHKLTDAHWLQDLYFLLPLLHLIHMIHNPLKSMTIGRLQECMNGFTDWELESVKPNF